MNEASINKKKAYHAAWYAANREKERANQATWRAANNAKVKEWSAAWLAENREKNKALCAAWRAANPEKNRARANAWYAANSEKVRPLAAARYAANPEIAKAYQIAWRKANPEAIRIQSQNRRARKKSNGGVLSQGLSAKLFKLQKGKCPCCQQPLGDDYHLDHKMPLALGGANTDGNMQLLRAKCNRQKSDKHPVDFMQQRGFLL